MCTCGSSAMRVRYVSLGGRTCFPIATTVRGESPMIKWYHVVWNDGDESESRGQVAAISFFWTHNTEVDQADCVSLVHHKTVGVEEEWNQVLRQGWTKCSGYPHLSISIILPPSLCSPPVVSWLWLWMDHMCGPGGKGERWVDFSTPIEQSPPGCDGSGIRTISFARSAD